MATTRNTACCAVQEIEGLTWNLGETPEKALRDLFSSVVRYGSEDSIYSFYIFTGVVEYKFDPDVYYNHRKYKQDTEGLDVKYGERLAKFIKKNKLGEVTTGRPEWNRVNHPDHKVRVWVWRPHARNLFNWLKRNKRVARKAA